MKTAHISYINQAPFPPAFRFKCAASSLLFAANFDGFHRTETYLYSMSRSAIASAAAEKHPILSGTFGSEIKPTP